MIISELTMQIVAGKEKYNEDLNRCLNVSVCPQCGAHLAKQGVGGDNLIEIEYTCVNCGFTHTRPE